MRQIGPGFTGVADHIDALNAELSEARARITELEAEAAAASTDRYDWLTAERAAAIARAEAAEAQVAKLREAAAPFVAHYTPAMDGHPDTAVCWSYPIMNLGAVRKLRAALEPAHD